MAGAARAEADASASITADAAAAEADGEAVQTSGRGRRRSAAPQRMAGIGFPDPIFRMVVGAFASDVVDYLFGGFAERMRAPVRAAC